MTRARLPRLLIAAVAATVVASATIDVRVPLVWPLTATLAAAYLLVRMLRLSYRLHALARGRAVDSEYLDRRFGPDAGLSLDALRIGTAERDEVINALHRHFGQGRLDQDELDERLSTALSARTGAELAPLLADLPRLPREVRRG